MQLHENAAQLRRFGINVYVITFESRSRVAAHQERETLPFPLLRDPDRAAYRRFGLGCQSATTIWGPSTLWYYARKLLHGELPNRADGADQYQLGGDVLMYSDGSRGLIYRSPNPADRPPITSILRLVNRKRS